MICTREVDFIIEACKACVAIVENADRLGISKLHQIRNCIMSSSEDAKVCLISSTKRPDTLKKLNMIGQTMDGQTLISNDLKTRVEGANLGFNK